MCSLADEEGRFGPDQRQSKFVGRSVDGTVHLDDVRWGFVEGGGSDAEGNTPIFLDAYVNPDDVRDVYMVIEPFEPEWLMAHAFLYFEMPLRDCHDRHDEGWVLSVEAHTLKGVRFDAIRGMGRKFPIIYQMGSWRDSIMRRCRILGHHLFCCKLALTPEQKRKLVSKALSEAVKDRHGEYFNTLSDSCFSNALRLLNEVLPSHQRVPEWIVPRVLHHLSASLPTYGDVELYGRGLLADQPVHVVQPDRTRFPRKQKTRGPLWRVLRRLSEQSAMHPLMRLLGGAAGAVCGARVGRGPLAWVGGVVGGYLGQNLGRTISNVVFVRSRVVLEPCEKWLDQDAVVT